MVAPAVFCAIALAPAARPQGAPPAAETQEQVFAKGLPFFIASASLGEPLADAVGPPAVLSNAKPVTLRVVK